MPTYKSKAEVEKKLQTARNKLHKVRQKWLSDKTEANEKAKDAALKECVDLQLVLDRWPK